MSVKVERSGRRSIQVDVEVPGTPEDVWQAIATGPGISSWFAPTTFEERDGLPIAMTVSVGPGMESRFVVTAWDAPRTFVSEGMAGSLARRRLRPSGASKRGRAASASSVWCKASSPARTTGTTS